MELSLKVDNFSRYKHMGDWWMWDNNMVDTDIVNITERPDYIVKVKNSKIIPNKKISSSYTEKLLQALVPTLKHRKK